MYDYNLHLMFSVTKLDVHMVACLAYDFVSVRFVYDPLFDWFNDRVLACCGGRARSIVHRSGIPLGKLTNQSFWRCVAAEIHVNIRRGVPRFPSPRPDSHDIALLRCALSAFTISLHTRHCACTMTIFVRTIPACMSGAYVLSVCALVVMVNK